jgi:hypothetical protein
LLLVNSPASRYNGASIMVGGHDRCTAVSSYYLIRRAENLDVVDSRRFPT